MRSDSEKEVQEKFYRVAVVIPVHNRSDLLENCLTSLKKQEFPINECEILICDDGSTQDLSHVLEKFSECGLNLRLLRQGPKGPAAARNMGFRSSTAPIFVCVDSDIVCGDHFLRRVIGALESHSDWVAAQGKVLPVGNVDSILFDAPRSDGGAYLSGASAYRAEALAQSGGFDESFPFPACEDADLAGRLLKLGKYGYVPDAVVYHPSRRVTVSTHWRWRKFWRYEMIIAKRYGFLSFPGHDAGPFPRLRVALAAVVTLPGGRFIEGLRWLKMKPSEGLLASIYALFDVFCGLCALPAILFSLVPPRRNYL